MALGSGGFFNLMPNTLVTLERFSVSLARDVFSQIETPASTEERQVGIF